MGKSYNGDDIRTLPNGSGYMYLRMAVRKVIDMFRNLCDNFILIGHTKEKMINKEKISIEYFKSLQFLLSICELFSDKSYK